MYQLLLHSGNEPHPYSGSRKTMTKMMSRKDGKQNQSFEFLDFELES